MPKWQVSVIVMVALVVTTMLPFGKVSRIVFAVSLLALYHRYKRITYQVTDGKVTSNRDADYPKSPLTQYVSGPG